MTNVVTPPKKLPVVANTRHLTGDSPAKRQPVRIASDENGSIVEARNEAKKSP